MIGAHARFLTAKTSGNEEIDAYHLVVYWIRLDFVAHFRFKSNLSVILNHTAVVYDIQQRSSPLKEHFFSQAHQVEA